jgi:hypothetical protein
VTLAIPSTRIAVAWLLAPTAWAVAFEANYAALPEVCHQNWWLVPHLLFGAALIASAVGVFLGWRTHAQAGTPPTHGFLALGGMMFSSLIIALIIAQWFPAFWIDPCAH